MNTIIPVYTISLPEMPNIEAIIKTLIERQITEKLTEWAEMQVRAMIAASGGPVALVNNIDIEMEIGTVVLELPTLRVSKRQESFSFDVPQVTMKTKVVANLHVPEIYMARERLPFDHHHCKTEWVIKHIGLGIKTKIPKTTCWTTPAYADVPKTRMVLREFKTDVPELVLRAETVKFDVPTLTSGTAMISLEVPQVKKINFDLEGVIKDFVPGGSMLLSLLELIQEAREFRDEIRSQVEGAIGRFVNPVLEKLKKLQEGLNTGIDSVQNRYAVIIKELEEKAGEHSEVIQQQIAEQKEKVDQIRTQLQPILDAIDKVNLVIQRARNIVDRIKLIG